MRRIYRLIGRQFKLAASALGLEQRFRVVRKRIEIWPYKNKGLFRTSVGDKDVLFSTIDPYSKTWFFPRYSGGQVHESAVTNLLVSELESATIFIDVGAHLGWYTCISAKHLERGEVYAFEMDDLNFRLLEQNVALNELKNVRTINLAVSDSTGIVAYQRKVRIPNPEFHLIQSSDPIKTAEAKYVRSIRLDDFASSHSIVPDVIKIDVEGAEMDVLLGMNQLLSSKSMSLFIEIHPEKLDYFQASVHQLISLLIEKEFEVYKFSSKYLWGEEVQLKPIHSGSELIENSMLYARKRSLISDVRE